MDFRKVFENLLNWVYPPSCVHCGKPGAVICDACLSALEPVGEHFCSVCGKPLKKGHHCSLCRTQSFRFQASRAPYIYDGPAASMIKKLKYSGIRSLVPDMAGLMADFWKTLGWDADMLIPVPLSSKRQTERGFNQSAMIGQAFCRRTGIPFKGNALVKTRDTRQQVGLQAEQRRENLIGAFTAEPVLVEGQRILLVDDVMTTGSTFAECSAVLLDAGAKTVKCLSFATTTADHGMNKMLNAQ